jgi:hypothetical protein|tara:strand:- start:2973 stop:3200 length:228 start_codon:yes stop_codon:yes gene_type:complete
MYIEINQVELCCALASNRTIKDFYAAGKTDSDINVDCGTHTEYTPEAQEVFDKYYDHYWNMVDRCNVTRSTISVG